MVKGSDYEDGQAYLSEVVKQALWQDVTDKLRKAILDGTFKPGQRIQQEKAASMMGVSPGPVREALAYLEQEGLVTRSHNRGFCVRGFALRDLDEVHSLRLVLELLAVEYAIRHARKKDLTALHQVTVEMAELISREASAEEAAELDFKFHDLLCKSSRHSRLYKSWSLLHPQTKLLVAGARAFDYTADAAATHGAILQAIREKDTERAQKLIEEHLTASYIRLRSAYQDGG